MLIHLLQTVTPEAEQIAQKFSSDSLTTKSAEIMEILRNTPPRELVEEMITSFIKFGIKVLVALVIYFVGAWLIRRFKNVIAKAFTRRGADATLTSFIQSLVTAVLWIILIMVMIGTLGINTTSLAALLAAGGMAIGMAMSGTVQNFAGGIMLLAFKPFKAGDYIEAQGYAGTVKEINIVSTKITTFDNKLIILPNGALSNGTINNYSANPVRRIDLRVDVAYGCDAAAVKEKLLQIIGTQEFGGILHPHLGEGLRLFRGVILAERSRLYAAAGRGNLLPVPADGRPHQAGLISIFSFINTGLP